MNRRQLAFLITVNALISFAIALGVAWAIEARRPDPEELAALYTPQAQPIAMPAVPTPVDQAPTAAVEEEPAMATPTLAPIATTGDEEVYTVQAGDSLGAIAGRYGISVADLVAANELDNPDYVFSGQRLTIPRSGTAITHTVASTATAASPATPAPQSIRFGTLEAPGNLLSEAVSIVNESNLALNLQGWRLEREGGPAYSFGDVSLFPGGSIWVHSRDGVNTSVALYWNQPNPIWQGGAVMRLINPENNVVASYTVP
jgi:LysM repeat protein